MEYLVSEISVEICNRLGIDIKGKKSGNILIKCLNAYHDDKHPSMSLSIDKGVCHCFSCGYSANLKNLYYEKFGRSIFKDLGIQRSIPLKKQEIYQTNFDDKPLTDFTLTGLRYRPDITDASKAWITKRGFDVQTLEMLKIQYLKYGKIVRTSDPLNKESWMTFHDMMMIPVYEKGKLISFEARDIYDKKHWEEKLKKAGKNPDDYTYKKVLYPKFSSVNTLFQLDELDKNSKLYVVEGLMDVISLKTNNKFINSTSTFGASITERQFYLLSQFKEICIIPNNDAPGLAVIKKFQERGDVKNVTVLTLPQTVKDVNDVLQGKDNRFSCIEDMLNMNWGRGERELSSFNVEKYIEKLGEKQ
jgi:DNA primase